MTELDRYINELNYPEEDNLDMFDEDVPYEDNEDCLVD